MKGIILVGSFHKISNKPERRYTHAQTDQTDPCKEPVFVQNSQAEVHVLGGFSENYQNSRMVSGTLKQRFFNDVSDNNTT
jgi:hypothetical protein